MHAKNSIGFFFWKIHVAKIHMNCVFIKELRTVKGKTNRWFSNDPITRNEAKKKKNHQKTRKRRQCIRVFHECTL